MAGFRLHTIGRIIAVAFLFHFMALDIDVIDRHGPCNEIRRQLQPKKTKVGYISRLCNSERRFTRPSLLIRRSTLVLKVGVLYGGQMVKYVASYSQRRLR